MTDQLKPGIKYKTEIIVEKENTATAFGSGTTEVFATPAMIAFMEHAAMNCVKIFLLEGNSTVGIHINVSHIKATPVGMKVYCKAKLLEIDGRKLMFEVIASDEEGGIGSGTHTRFIINEKEFIDKLG
jgi:predicted thioesterase